MFNKLEFSDINRYFVSIGTILIALAFLLPYFYLKENFGIIITENDYASYTEISKQIIDNKQKNILFFQNWILCVSGIFFLIGCFFTIIGIRRWIKRQKIIDQKFDKEVTKLDYEIQQLTPEEKVEKVEEELQTSIIPSKSNKGNSFNTDQKRIVKLYNEVEKSIINKIKSNDFINKKFDVFSDVRINQIFFDILLKSKESKYDFIAEIKFFDSAFTFFSIKKSLEQIDYKLEFYKKNTNKNISGKMILVYNDINIDKNTFEKTIDNFRNQEILKRLLNKIDIYTIKFSELEDFDVKNLIKYQLA